MKYNIIDMEERNAREEMKEYTFEELKKFFEPSEELKSDAPELAERWENIKDLSDLEEYLRFEADGMQVHYKIVPVEE